MLKLTPEQAQTIIVAVQETGPGFPARCGCLWTAARAGRRAQQTGAEFSESCFLAGVATAFVALDSGDLVPVWWTLGVMAGRPVLLDEQAHQRLIEERDYLRDCRREQDELRRHMAGAKSLLAMLDTQGRRARRLLNEIEGRDPEEE